jgi:hypothetical protein
MVATRLGTTD